MPRIFISDSTAGGTHGATIRSAILAANPALSLSDITLQLNATYQLSSVLADMATARNGGYEAFVHSTIIAPQLISTAQEFWEASQTMRVFVPLGSNSHEQLTYTPDTRPAMVTCGAGVTQNETGYGNALWFFDDDNGSPGNASSFSTGVIVGKLLAVKDGRGCGWWEAIYAAAQTASHGGSPTLNDGYGIIDTAAAIAWTGDVPWDPYLQIGTVGALSGSAAGSLATLTPAAVANATHYYLERNTGGGWSVFDVRASHGSFLVTLTDGVQTSFRYRASNPGGTTEYSNTITLQWDDEMANKRKLIRNAMVTAFEAATADTYNYSWAGKVEAWRTNPVTPQDGRFLVIKDATVSPEQEFAGGSLNQWLRYADFELKAYTGESTDTRTIADNINEDIEKVIGANKTWSGYAHTTRWIDTNEEKDQQELAIIAVIIRVRVFFMTTEWAME